MALKDLFLAGRRQSSAQVEVSPCETPNPRSAVSEPKVLDEPPAWDRVIYACMSYHSCISYVQECFFSFMLLETGLGKHAEGMGNAAPEEEKTIPVRLSEASREGSLWSLNSSSTKPCNTSLRRSLYFPRKQGGLIQRRSYFSHLDGVSFDELLRSDGLGHDGADGLGEARRVVHL